MELYFIRHGQSRNNAGWDNPEYKENPDPALTDIGHEQARLLADYLVKNQPISNDGNLDFQNRRGFGLTHIYTSLMERAVNTAALTARGLPEVPFASWPEIHESGGIYGRDGESKLKGLPGKSRSYFEQTIPELSLRDDLDEKGWWNRPFETEEECRARARQFLTDLLARHGDKRGQADERVAIFSHGGFFIHLMCVMLDLPWRQATNGMKSWFLLNNCSITRFDIRGEDLILSYMNRTDHLPDHLITG